LRLILDQNFPKRVVSALTGHSFQTAHSMGWATLTNGDLLSAAEQAGFDAMLTADQRIRYQQNMRDRRIALVVVSLNSKTVLMQHVTLLQAAIDRAVPGGYEHVEIPRPTLVRNPGPRLDDPV
jgi:hypothetical protein